jgi:hypothetical protein
MVAAVVAAVALVSVPTAADAAGKLWGSLSVSDGGAVRGKASGTASTTTVHLKNTSIYTGNATEPTRVETSWYFHEDVQDPDGSYHTSWEYEGRGDTPNAGSSSVHSSSVQTALLNDATQGRAEPRICVPKPWGVPVPCSATAILTLSY